MSRVMKSGKRVRFKPEDEYMTVEHVGCLYTSEQGKEIILIANAKMISGTCTYYKRIRHIRLTYKWEGAHNHHSMASNGQSPLFDAVSKDDAINVEH